MAADTKHRKPVAKSENDKTTKTPNTKTIIILKHAYNLHLRLLRFELVFGTFLKSEKDISLEESGTSFIFGYLWYC